MSYALPQCDFYLSLVLLRPEWSLPEICCIHRVSFMQTETDEAKVLWKFFYLIQEYKKFFQPLAGQRKASTFYSSFMVIQTPREAPPNTVRFFIISQKALCDTAFVLTLKEPTRVNNWRALILSKLSAETKLTCDNNEYMNRVKRVNNMFMYRRITLKIDLSRNTRVKIKAKGFVSQLTLRLQLSTVI